MILIENIDAYCAKHNISIKEFERRCGVANSSVHKWRVGVQSPSMKSITYIERGTGIPSAKWLTKGGVA